MQTYWVPLSENSRIRTTGDGLNAVRYLQALVLMGVAVLPVLSIKRVYRLRDLGKGQERPFDSALIRAT